MQTLDQQIHDVEQSVTDTIRAAERNYLGKSKDELQLIALSQLTLAILMLARVLTERMEVNVDR